MKKFSSIAICALCCALLAVGCGKDSGRNVGKVRKADGMLNTDNSKTVKVADGVEIKMVLVEAGKFTMNRNDGENFANEVEHEVTITKPFYIGQTEVTQKQYNTVVAMWKAKFPEKYAAMYPGAWNAGLDNKKYFGEYIKQGDFFFSKEGKGKDRISGLNLENYPVENISWIDAMDFCMMLNDLQLAPAGYKFTLPTEAQWEFAACGGNAGSSKPQKYSGSDNIDNVAWYNETASGRTGRAKEVGDCNEAEARSCNDLGLYDMSGNVAEWCLDSWQKKSDDTKAEIDEPWSFERSSWIRNLIHKEIEKRFAVDNKRDVREDKALSGEEKEELDKFKCTWRAYRGGAWSGSANVCRVSNRGAFSPYELNRDVKENKEVKDAKNNITYSIVGYPHVGMRLVLVPIE